MLRYGDTFIVCSRRLIEAVKWDAAYATSLLHGCREEWRIKMITAIIKSNWQVQSVKCWISSSIWGIKERCEFFVGNSSRQIAGLPRHRPLQGSRQPALISKGGVKEKSLLYSHTVPYILLSLSPPRTPSVHLSPFPIICSIFMHLHITVCNAGTQQWWLVTASSKQRAIGGPHSKARKRNLGEEGC